MCYMCARVCVCVLFLCHYLSLILFFFGSFKGNRFEFDRFEGGGGRRNRAVRDPLTWARDSCFISIAFIARKLKIERKRKKGAPVAFPSNPNFFFFSRNIYNRVDLREEKRTTYPVSIDFSKRAREREREGNRRLWKLCFKNRPPAISRGRTVH